MLKNKKFFMGTAFVSGFSLMALEILYSRTIAPLMGNSLYTWTSVIGVTILGLAVGNIAGGKLSDQFPGTKTLANTFFISATCTLVMVLLTGHIQKILVPDVPLLINTLAVAMGLFFPPSFSIGMTGPMIMKLYSQEYTHIGSDYGNVSAWWSFGSILGIFMTGFFLIDTLGTKETLLGISLILLITGIICLCYENGWKQKNISNILLFILFSTIGIALYTLPSKQPSGTNLLYADESAYYYIQVREDPSTKTRLLFLDFDSHSIKTQKHPNPYYTEIYPLFSVLKKTISKAHVIGGGAYILPKNIAEYYDASVDVTELDPVVSRVAQDFFDADSERIRTFNEDARHFFRNNEKLYDLVFGDAYNSFISVPWHLLTKEFMRDIREDLTEGGIYALNFIGTFSGPGKHMTDSIAQTFGSVFPGYIIIGTGKDSSDVQNIILIGQKGSGVDIGTLVNELKDVQYGDILTGYMQTGYSAPNSSLILTDNYAPVEKLMRPIIDAYYWRYADFFNSLVTPTTQVPTL